MKLITLDNLVVDFKLGASQEHKDATVINI